MTPLIHATGTVIPDQVDLRDVLWPVEQIRNTTAAASSAAATALEYHLNRINEPPADLSTLFIHYNARRLAGNRDKWSGASMGEAMRAIDTFGVCRELTWPFDVASLDTAPPAEAYAEGKHFARIAFAQPVDPFQALSLRYPLPFVMKVADRQMTEAGKTGVLPSMTPEELQRVREHPSHAMVMVGYDKPGKRYIARNCWGTGWGQDGHCDVPFELVRTLVSANALGIWFVTNADALKAHVPSTAGAMDAAAPTPQPESLAALAARMKADIKSDLQRDLADATRRVRERK